MFEKPVEGRRIRLEPMGPAFVTESYVNWLSDPEVFRHLSTSRQALSDLATYVDARAKDPDVRFWAIIDRDRDVHVGNVKLEPIDWKKKRATFGLLIGDRECWGQGIGREVTELVVRHSFESLELETIELGVEETNDAALKVYERAGFKIVSHSKYAVSKENGSMGMYWMEINRENWK